MLAGDDITLRAGSVPAASRHQCGLLMQPSHTRLICRAHNRFTPSIVLWQHFVLPNRPLLHQRRLSSSAVGIAQDHASDNGRLLNSPEASGLEHFEAELAETEKDNVEPTLHVRKMSTGKGNWHHTKVDASVAKNVQLQYDSRQASLTQPEKLLATARAAFDVAGDYKGVAVKPMVNPKPIKESSLPWCLEKEERVISGIDRLGIEIKRFYEFTRPGRFESIARKHVIEQVRSHVRDKLPEHVLEVFGSERTGIAFATSDIDFRLLRKSMLADPAKAKFPPTASERGRAMKDLQELHWGKLKKHKAYLLPVVRYARYPLISMQDRQSGLDIQIVLANDTSVSRGIMQDYMEQYPYLRQLYYVVKTMFDVRGLSDVFRGGFGSYSLFMMVVASIRHKPHPRNDAAGGLINFLEFWRNFDTRKQGISIEPVGLFDKDSQPVMTDKAKAKIEQGTAKPLPTYMLSLRDPADETNDLGRKGIAIKHVQVTFRSLAHQLDTDMRVNTRASILGPLVGSSYMLDRAHRHRLHNYGKRLLNQMQSSLAAKAKAIRDAEETEKGAIGVEKDIKEEDEASTKATGVEDAQQPMSNTPDERTMELKSS